MNLYNIFSTARLLILTGLLAISLQSCLREDDDCDTQSRVRIVVRTIAETRSPDTGQIDNITIYIFDEEQRYAGYWHGGAYVYGTIYEAYVDLDPGTYQFVVWSNLGAEYTAPETAESADALTVAARYPTDGIITTDITDFHHGMLTGARVIEREDNEFNVVLIPNTYKLNFTVEGLPADDDDYTFSVRDNNSHYAFDNSIIEGQPDFYYMRTARFDGAVIESSMTTMKLAQGRAPRFDFSNGTSGKSLYADNLVQMIQKAYSESGQRVDFGREFEFDIKLSFHGSLGVTISVNGWSYFVNDTHLSG